MLWRLFKSPQNSYTIIIVMLALVDSITLVVIPWQPQNNFKLCYKNLSSTVVVMVVNTSKKKSFTMIKLLIFNKGNKSWFLYKQTKHLPYIGLLTFKCHLWSCNLVSIYHRTECYSFNNVFCSIPWFNKKWLTS